MYNFSSYIWEAPRMDFISPCPILFTRISGIDYNSCPIPCPHFLPTLNNSELIHTSDFQECWAFLVLLPLFPTGPDLEVQLLKLHTPKPQESTVIILFLKTVDKQKVWYCVNHKNRFISHDTIFKINCNFFIYRKGRMESSYRKVKKLIQ